MSSKRNLGIEGRNLIKSFEGYRNTAYLCQANVWTIGFGHTAGVKAGQVITLAQAETYLDVDVASAVNAVNSNVNSDIDINQNQFDSLVSFTFNCGVGALRSSTLLKYVNANDMNKAANEFLAWNKVTQNGVKVVSNGLVRRREAERLLFLKPVVKQGFVKTDSGEWNYYKEDGSKAVGWYEVENKHYYFEPNGNMKIGWVKYKENWYYLNSDGYMVVSWYEVDYNWYYFNSKGEMEVGWVNVDNEWYYLKDTGVAVMKEWRFLGEEWYYFNIDGKMVVGCEKIGNKTYVFGEDGRMLKGDITLKTDDKGAVVAIMQ